MKDRESSHHPGPMAFMSADAESIGILIALDFALLAVVGLPIGKWFVAGVVLLGTVVALLLKVFRKPPIPQPSILQGSRHTDSDQ